MMPPPDIKTRTRKKADPAVSRGGRRLTQLLIESGSATVIGRDGIPKTRDEMLVDQMWEMALGLKVVGEDDNGKVYAKPDSRIALAILERREGKTPAAMPDDSQRLTAADKVSEIARNSINSEADALGTVSEFTEDMDLSNHRNSDSEETG